MTDEAKKQKLDLSLMSEAELEALVPAIERELEKRRERKKRDALEKIRAAAAEIGMTPEELLGLVAFGGGGGEKRRRGGRRGPIAWRHPDDAAKVYRGGKKPDWLVALEQEGREAVKVE